MDNPAGFFMWVWAAILCALLVTCTARADTLQDVKNAVDGRILYKRYYTSQTDTHFIPKGETGIGNCVVFAHTYKQDAKASGIDGRTYVCQWRNSGLGHAVFVAEDGRVLDNRHPYPITLGKLFMEGCI